MSPNQSSDAIVLHGVGSPNVIKVVLALEELGLDYRLNFVDVFSGAQFSDDFLAKSPLGKVPVLEDPRLGMPLVESGAILLWLAEREGRFLPPHAPPTQAARADVLQWLMIQMGSIGPMLGQLTHFNICPSDTAPYARARYRAVAEKLYFALGDRLRGREYLAGDYSIADMATQPWAYYLERHGFDPAAFPDLVRWREAIAARPAAQRAAARVHQAFVAPSADTMANASDDDLDRFFGRTDAVPVTDYSLVRQM